MNEKFDEHNMIRRLRRAEEQAYKCRLWLWGKRIEVLPRWPERTVMLGPGRSAWWRLADVMAGMALGLSLACSVLAVKACEKERDRAVLEKAERDYSELLFR